MKKQGRVGWSEAIRVGLFELFVVMLGLIFVRKEVYLAGQYSAMILHWQEYALLVLMFVDGTTRGFGEMHGQGEYMSPFRKKLLRYLLPCMLFLFVSCSSLCDKLNAACIHDEWWRDLGLALLAAGVGLCVWSQRTVPKELEAAIVPAVEETEASGSAESGSAASAPGSAGGSQASQSKDIESGKMPAIPGSDPKDPVIDAGEPPVSTTGDPSQQALSSERSVLPGAEPTDPGAKKSGSAGYQPASESTDPALEDGESAVPPGSEPMELESRQADTESSSEPSEKVDNEPGSTLRPLPIAFCDGTPAVLTGVPPASTPDLIEVRTDIETEGPWKLLRYPVRTSILLELIGVSMTLSAWMPLLTLPGLLVLFKWELADLEAFRISQFGKKYLNYKERSWYLIPYIY